MPNPEKSRKLINAGLKIRWVIILSWILLTVGLTCALFTFFSGHLEHNLRFQATLIQFNLTTLGIDHYDNVSSPFHQPIRALVPEEVQARTPLTITRYLGVPDWYSISYLWTCAGMYYISEELNQHGGPLYLTNKQRNATCGRFKSDAHNFSLHSAVLEALHPSVKSLAGDVPVTVYNMKGRAWAWGIGCLCAFIAFILYPFSFRREWTHGTGSWCMIPAGLTLISCIIFLIIALNEHMIIDPYSKYSVRQNRAFALTLLAIFFTFAAFWAGCVGWGLGVWLEDSMPLEEKMMKEDKKQKRRAGRALSDAVAEGTMRNEAVAVNFTLGDEAAV